MKAEQEGGDARSGIERVRAAGHGPSGAGLVGHGFDPGAKDTEHVKVREDVGVSETDECRLFPRTRRHALEWFAEANFRGQTFFWVFVFFHDVVSHSTGR